MTTSIGLDLGTTRVKAARLGSSGRLIAVHSEAAPPLRRRGLTCEVDARAYAEVAERVLESVRQSADEEPSLGIASQRSSFLLWDARSGEPATPLVSWQDRRGEGWCRRHPELARDLARRTGLRLSGHYVGPKLAAMMEEDARLRRGIAGGFLRLGTLDSYLLWRWSGSRAHRIDPTMAARTALFDLTSGGWSGELLAAFGIPPRLLPEVLPSVGCSLRLPGRARLEAVLADQAAAALVATGGRSGTALVSLGTGCFVLRPAGKRPRRLAGYLTGPLLALEEGEVLYAIEGTINGGAAVVGRRGPGPTPLPVEDPHAEAFCLPDSAGVGAPHWRPRAGVAFSRQARALGPCEQRRVVLEGLLFRVREILEGLFPRRVPESVRLAGGLAGEAFLVEGLAACLGRPVEKLKEPEATLLGIARLAAGRGLSPAERPEAAGGAAVSLAVPARRGRYLPAKYERWRRWVGRVLQRAKD